MLFNVCFILQSGRFQALRTAATSVAALVEAAKDGCTGSMLFPEASDGYYQKTLNRAIPDLGLHDRLLNYEQLKAGNTVVKETYGPVPYIILGPPGTGKIKTMVELALQLASEDKAAHLLVCAPSDPAAEADRTTPY